MLNRELSLRGRRACWHATPSDIPHAPQGRQDGVLSPQSGGEMLEYLSIRPSKWSALSPRQSPRCLGKCQRVPAHAASYRVACGAKNLCEKEEMSALTFAAVWLIWASGVPLTDRGNMVERIYVSACQDGELLCWAWAHWVKCFYSVNQCARNVGDECFGRLDFKLCKHFSEIETILLPDLKLG